MNKRFYYRLGVFLGFAGTLIGIIGFIMKYWIGDSKTLGTIINYSICTLAGLLVLVVNAMSVKHIHLRYLSKQFQVMLLYILGTILMINSGDLGGLILFIMGLVLAFRYSFLERRMLLFTAVYNCLLFSIHAWTKDIMFFQVIHEQLFIIFSYILFYLLYRDYSLFLKKRFERLNNEIDKARKSISFGAQLNRRMASANLEHVDFTRKEYEVMVALCVYERFSNDELSDFMNISIATVKSHLNNIYGKTGIHNRSRLLAVYKDIFIDRRKEEEQAAVR